MDSIKLLVLEELWRKDPQSRVFLRLAEELRKSGQYERAISVCKAGLPYHQDYVPALVSLGRSSQALGKDEDAERVFSRVLELAPDNTHALRGLGNLLADRGRQTEALGYLETLILHEPSDEETPLKIEELKSYLESNPKTQAPDQEPLAEVTTQELAANEQEPEVSFFPESSTDGEALFTEEEAGEDVALNYQEIPTEPEMEQDDADDSLANLDVAFEKAIDETDQDSDLFQVEDLEEDENEVPGRHTPPTQHRNFDIDALEALITAGLKHEKMEHLEKARTLYLKVLETNPGDGMAKEHLERVVQLLSSERPEERKIRVLSNWLDKIKGVYDVP